MKSTKYTYFFLLLFLILCGNTYSQIQDDEYDKCGYNSILAKSYLDVFGDHWGYSYDSLLVDLAEWSSNPYITIDSLGASVQNRAIWQLSITSNDTINPAKQTVFFHVRTHPGEVQSWWVAEQVINKLTSETEFARLLRENCVFYILPMYNPDGVELEYPRQNANGVDLESNWDENPVEPEVAILKGRFSELMASNAPIKVAMNMHSAYGTHRYFVYHDSVGTSVPFTYLEQDYIEGVRSYYLNGIEPWYYKITWTNGTPPYYPESWFWLHHQEAVMALTYEDWNSAQAFNFDSTANAILNGIADFLEIEPATIIKDKLIAARFNLLQNYPNPFNPITIIKYTLPKSEMVMIEIFNLLGQKIEVLINKQMPAGSHEIEFTANDLPSGVYLYRIEAGEFQEIKKMILIR